MADIYGAVKTLLANDATLAALATNGVKDDDDVGREGLTESDLTGATPIIQPTIYINWETDIPWNNAIVSRRIFFTVFFYDDSTYGTIESMVRQVYDLLHQQRVAIDGDDYVYAFLNVGDTLRFRDDRLGGAASAQSRYEGHYIRR